MRRLGYGLFALLVLVAITPALSFAWRSWEAWRNLEPARNAGLDERVLFEPVAGRPLEFNVSTHQGWFALQGFVVAPPARRARGMPVTIGIGLHGASGIEREQRYLALPAVTHVRPYGLLDGLIEQAVWVLPTEWIDLTGRPDVQAVSVRVLDTADGVHTVLWRGAIDQRLPDPQVRLRYRRLSDASREALTDDWVTPAALVDPRVKQELLRYRQQRIGPLGQPGEAFIARRVLRQRPGATPRRYDPRILALAIGPALHVGLELDAARTAMIDARSSDGSPLALTVIGPVAPGAPVRRMRVDGRWRGPLAAGRYELHAAAHGDVDVRDAASGDPLVPAGLRPRNHRASTGRVLRYRLHALGDAPPPVRIRLRAERGDTRATLHFVDAQGARLASSVVAVPWQPSRYDRPAIAPDRAVSEPVQIDLQPPAQAHSLRVDADEPVLAHVATTLPRSGRGARRRWYSFQPEVDPRSVLSQGVVLVEQPRLAMGPIVGTRALGVLSVDRASTPSIREREPATAAPAPPRLRLRLRPERTDARGDTDAD